MTGTCGLCLAYQETNAPEKLDLGNPYARHKVEAMAATTLLAFSMKSLMFTSWETANLRPDPGVMLFGVPVASRVSC